MELARSAATVHFPASARSDGNGPSIGAFHRRTLCADLHTGGWRDFSWMSVVESTMSRAEKLRAQAGALYDLAKATPHPDESLLHVLHAIELETDADRLER